VRLYTDWYAIRVKANRERVTSESLKNKGYDVCLPVYQQSSRRTRGVRVLEVPLFPGYVFSRFDVRNRLPVLSTPGVVNIVGIGKTPQPVDPAEMEAVLALNGSSLKLSPHPYLPVGLRVQALDGPLRGIEGVIVEHTPSDQLVVSVTLLQRSIAVNVDRRWLTPVETAVSRAS
jgi:transcription antitermination factor NusG